ncbi:MAG TPA: hypothetical protein VKR58_08575, partial [Aquella sp.]|nr:hypothetical protein [Aquella sp.]
MKNKPYKILFCLISSTIFMNAPQALQYECVKNNQAPTDNNKYGIEIMYANTDQPDQIALDHISLDARIRTSAKSPMDFNITYTKNKKTGLYDLLYVENRNAYASDMNWELVFKDGIPPTLKIPTKPNSKTYNSYQCTLIYKNADSLIG